MARIGQRNTAPELAVRPTIALSSWSGAFCRPEPHIVSMEPKFGDWEGIPVRWLPGEAWGFIKGEWVWVHPAEVGMNGAELDEESFLATFGRLMALPAIAFQPRPER